MRVLVTLLLMALVACASHPLVNGSAAIINTTHATNITNTISNITNSTIPSIKPTTIPKPTPKPSVQEFSLTADDTGYFQDDGMTQVNAINVTKGDVKIKITVKTSHVYYGGLDFRGCGVASSGTVPGSSTTLEFNATTSCKISSYWPLTSAWKADLNVVVQ